MPYLIQVMQQFQNQKSSLNILNKFKVLREYTIKVDKLELSEAQREKDNDSTEQKNIIQMEPQLMITAGPALGISSQYPQNYTTGATPISSAAVTGRNLGYPYLQKTPENVSLLINITI